MILFVDDEPYYMGVFKEWLDRKYPVVAAYSADDALRFISERGSEIDLIILDIMMTPGEALREAYTNHGRRTGMRLFERIREMYPQVPIVVLTAVTKADVQAELEARGRCKYLIKPITPMELELAIGELGVAPPG